MGDYQISVKHGMDVSFNVTITDSTTGNAKDITGWTVYFMVKRDIEDADSEALISKTITSHSDPTNGVTLFSIAREDTEELNYGKYVYDIQYITAGGLRKGSAVDNFVITPAVRLED